MLLVEFVNGKLADITPLPVPVTQQLAVLKGDLSAIEQQLTRWRDAPAESNTWLDIEISGETFIHDMQRQVLAMTETLPVKVILLRRSRQQREHLTAHQNNETLSELSVQEVFERRLTQATLEADEAKALRTLFAQTLEGLHEKNESP